MVPVEMNQMSSVWTGQLSFGLVTMPVKLRTASRGERISFNQLHEICGSRINQKVFCPVCDRIVERTELVRGYEFEKNSYVHIDDQELKAIAPESSKTIEVTQFVPAAQVDSLYLESSYYLCPDKGGEKPFALLRAALADSEVVGLARVSMHNREHILVIRPGAKGLVAHTMFYADELQADNEYQTDTRLVGKKELDLARSLVVAMSADFEPAAFADSYREQVLALIDAKRNGKSLKARKVTSIKRPSSMEDQLAASLKAMRPVPATKKRRAS